MMNDGSLRRTNGYTSAAAPDAGNYISAEVKSGAAAITKTSDDALSDGVCSGTLAATEPGDIVITLTACIDGGEPISRDVTVRAEYPPKLGKVEVSLDKTAIPVSRTAKASLTLTRTDGTALPEDEERTVVYSAAPEGIVTVAQDGTITAVGAGTATVTATVSTADVPEGVSGSAEIEVTAEPTLTSIVLTADSNAMIIGDEKKLEVSAAMSDSLAGDITKYNIEYESSDEAVAAVADDGTVTALAVGTAIITAKTKNEGGDDVSATLRITVYAEVPSTVIDFKQTVCRPDENHITPTETPGYTIVEDGSNYFRKYTYSDSGKTIMHVATRASGNAMWPRSSDMRNTFGIKVNIPVAGNYSVRMGGGKWYAGAQYSVFIDGVYVGDKNFWDGETSSGTSSRMTGEEEILNTVHLAAGEHEILFRVRYSSYSTAYMLLDTMSFIPVEGDTALSGISAEIPTELAIGEVYTAPAAAIMSDGSRYHFGVTSTGELDTVNTFTAAAAGTALTLSGFAAYEIGSSGNSRFTLTGIEAGTSEITFTATVGGKTVEKKATVNVSYDPIASVSAKTEAAEVFAGDKTKLIAKAELQSGREVSSAEISYESLTPDIAEVEGDTLTALAVGTARIKVTARFGNETVDNTFEVEVLPEGMTDVLVTAGGSEYIRFTDDADVNVEDYLVPLYVQAISNLGNEIDMTKTEVTARALTPEYATLDSAMNIVPVYADPETGSEAKFEVTVKNADGRIRTVTKTLLVVNAKTESTYMTDAKAKAAQENVKNYDWAEDAVNALAEDGIIKGTTVSTYSPANNITRADYAILLVRAFDLTSDDTANFTDVNASDYFAAELAVARSTGIVNGIGDNKYAPRRTITRQDMMVVIYRALEKLGKLGSTDAAIDASAYPDYADVADYARDAVNYLIANGLVNGKNGRIAPTDYTTRAEVAVLLKRILDYIK